MKNVTIIIVILLKITICLSAQNIKTRVFRLNDHVFRAPSDENTIDSITTGITLMKRKNQDLDIVMSNTYYTNMIRFTKFNFNKRIILHDSGFDQELVFDQSDFEGLSMGPFFAGKVIWYNSKAHDNIYMQLITPKIEISISNFKRGLELNGKIDLLDIEKSKIGGSLFLNDVSSNIISLEEDTINLDFRVINGSFKQKWEIISSVFNGKFEVRGCQLPKDIFFNKNTFRNDGYKVNLTYNKTDSLKSNHNGKDINYKCQIHLDVENAGNVIIDSKNFEIKLDSISSYEDGLIIYEKIMNTCKDLGMEESYRDFDVSYQKYRIKHNWLHFSDFMIWFQNYWWGFGYSKSNIITNILYAFVISFFIFFILYKQVFNTYFPNEDHNVQSIIIDCSKNLIERFKVVFFYTSIVFFSWKVDHERIDYRKHPWISLLIYAIYTVGIIHLAYLAAFVLA
ncbi:hypothetical protein BWI93_05150 [Siphonobacter sp. BAB-5385]|uniref:hypothetical protein n=1 Tax=Siphonobacter sp. BAB-5385 TaxID=1864822 RepID=UPI000B9EC7FC|nr:hypothetical protein [Siphonobacter sp. BAB-5385]OZI09193.1 hypothetical protein BWI93_05150 [Siphonobacter sp. BAB-5385]